MCPDANSSNGSYVVNNLYLDDRYDTFYYEKYHGSFQRDKYRLRHYNGDMSFIRLERKHKDGYVSYKETMKISEEQYQKIKSGKMDFILMEEAALWRKLALIYRLRGLRPAAIYAYRREAFVYDPGDVRFTFDSPLFDFAKAKSDILPSYDSLSHSYASPPYSLMLEVKFSGFLPELIKRLLDGLPLAHTEMSKYSIARERGFLPYGQI